jgi:hypothetical protein
MEVEFDVDAELSEQGWPNQVGFTKSEVWIIIIIYPINELYVHTYMIGPVQIDAHIHTYTYVY